MYNLGESFKTNPQSGIANSECVITGKKFRLTILTERLFRFEYNEEGIFTDELTTLVTNRRFEKPKFNRKEDVNYLEILTPYFKLTYTKDKKPKNPNLIATLHNSENYWFMNHVEAKNYPAWVFIDDKNKMKSIKTLYSLDGFATIDDSKNSIVNADGTITKRDYKGIDIYVFMYGKDFHLCLKDYFKLTGSPALLPRFALGNWWSRNALYDDNSLKELVDEFQDNEIPLSVMLLDKDWHIRKHMDKKHLKTGFTFNKELFKAPYDMISYLHTKGIRLGLNINPMEGFHDIDEYFEQAKTYLEVNEKGYIPFNVLSPKCADVYFKLFIHPLDALGVDFYWLDALDNPDLYLLKHYHFCDMMRNYKRRPLLLAYNTDMAAHRYPVLYSGKTLVSWDTLKLLPKFNSNAANIGLSWWSHDIGGYFKGVEDNELYIRYIQLGCFSPILRFGVEKGKYYKREPWRWDMKTSVIAKDYLKLRHKMIPYLYSEAYRYFKEGEPLIKPLYYTNPEMYDDVIYSNEYYFGSQFFIAPIIQKKDTVMDRVVQRFYLPNGVWYDFFTGKKFNGNKNYTMFFKDQNYPVFAKAGSIIPLGVNEQFNDTNPPKTLEIHFFPGVSNEYLLYEDDGISDLYKKGFYLLSKIEYNYLPNNYTVIVRALEGKSGIVPDYRNYKLVFRNTKKSDEVIVYNNKEMVKAKTYVDGPDFIVEVKDVRSIGQLTVNCKGKDIEIDAVKLINEDIEEIISDLQIETELKEKIDEILFSNLDIKKKRIEIRKLSKDGLEAKFIKLFLNLLEYVSQV